MQLDSDARRIRKLGEQAVRLHRFIEQRIESNARRLHIPALLWWAERRWATRGQDREIGAQVTGPAAAFAVTGPNALLRMAGATMVGASVAPRKYASPFRHGGDNRLLAASACNADIANRQPDAFAERGLAQKQIIIPQGILSRQ